jgi:hypothetical protein
MGMLYFRVRVSGVLALLLLIFSKILFPECTDLCRASMPSMNMVSTLYLFGTLENSQSTTPPSHHSRVCRSLSRVRLQWTIMICFTISGFRSFGSSLFGFLSEHIPTECMDLCLCPPRSSGLDLLWTLKL